MFGGEPPFMMVSHSFAMTTASRFHFSLDRLPLSKLIDTPDGYEFDFLALVYPIIK